MPPPLRPPTTPTREYGLFVDLRLMIPKPKAQEAKKNTWILAYTKRLVYTKVSTHHDPTRNQRLVQRLSHQVAASLKADQQRWVKTAGGKIEDLLTSEPPPPQGSMAPDEVVVQGC